MINAMTTGSFHSEGLRIAYALDGPAEAAPILLIHGFASNRDVNWRLTGWIETLVKAGYRTISLDNRGHGESDAPHDSASYQTPRMAGDALALLDHLGVARCAVIGFSMGARIAAFMALAGPERVRALVLGGLGSGLVDGIGDPEPIAAALMAQTVDAVADPAARAFRIFAEQTGSDRLALAACIRASRTTLSPAELSGLVMPSLVVVGSEDAIAGSPDRLAAMVPAMRAVTIARRDHMRTTGDRLFKQSVIEFFKENNI